MVNKAVKKVRKVWYTELSDRGKQAQQECNMKNHNTPVLHFSKKHPVRKFVAWLSENRARLRPESYF